MKPTLVHRLGLLVVAILAIGTGGGLVWALPSYLAAWPDSDGLIPTVIALIPLLVGVLFAAAVALPRLINPVLVIVAGVVLIGSALFSLLPIMEFHKFPYANDWATTWFCYAALISTILGIAAIVNAVLSTPSRRRSPRVFPTA